MEKILILLLVLPSLLFSQQSKENVDVVPFAKIENAPIYPGCDKSSNEKKRKCMSEKIAKFVAKEFDAGCASGLGSYGIYGRQRISVIFKIDTLGRATEIRARAAHLKLEREAIRVINMLPILKPGTQDGKKVIVPYSLPIVFQVGD
tara:strand:- start:77 stop:517 length:441 start_codon:yes stop_codon:yes gene_type:complete